MKAKIENTAQEAQENTATKKPRFGAVIEVPREKIITRVKMFQGREKEYSEESVNNIVREGFDKSLEPIEVWYDNKVDKYVVISGHSRFEASKRLFELGDKNLSTMLVKPFNGTMEEASDYAILESNRLSTQEGILSDIRAFKKCVEKGKNSECLKSAFKKDSKISLLQDLSHLNENGRFIETLNSDDYSQFTSIENFARWVGAIRRLYPAITDSQEREIFEYIYGGGTKNLPNKAEFFALIEKVVGRLDFDASKPLNLKNFVRKTVFEVNADEQISELNREVKELENRNEYLNGIIRKAQSQGNQVNEDWKTERNRNLDLINEKLLRIEKIKNDVKGLNKTEIDLFASLPIMQEEKKPTAKIEAVKENLPTQTEPQESKENLPTQKLDKYNFDAWLKENKKLDEAWFNENSTVQQQYGYIVRVLWIYFEQNFDLEIRDYMRGERYTMPHSYSKIEKYKPEYLNKNIERVLKRIKELDHVDKLPKDVIPIFEAINSFLFYENLPTQTEPQENSNIQPPQNKEQKFIDYIQNSIKDCIENDTKPLTKTQRAKVGESVGISEQKEVKELTEAAIVMLAREQALRTDLSLREKYDAIVSIYECQPVISEQDSTSKSAQQYSTPVPIAFLAGKFTQTPKTQKVFEPSAGNGLLTVAFPTDIVYVNELDKTRLESLKLQDFARVTDQNAANPFPTGWAKSFDAVLTNPPFGTTNKTQAQKYELIGLEHVMAHYALETMKDSGRCAIIIGGHSKYDERGRPTQGKERSFFYYLYTYYNVLDVINIDGAKLYRRQGTSFDIRLILINGRKAVPELTLPTVQKEVIADFTSLYNRILPFILYERPNSILQPRLDIDRMASEDMGNSDTLTSNHREHQSDATLLGGFETDTRYTGSEGGEREYPEPPFSFGYTSNGENDQQENSVRSDELGLDATSHRTSENLEVFAGGLSGENDESEGIGGGGTITDNFGGISNDSEREFRLLHEIEKNNGMENEKETTTDVGLLPYKPMSKNTNGEETLIPASMATEAYRSLARVQKEYGNIDDFVAKELQYTKEELFESLFNYQIDAVALAIYNIKNKQATIIGDQTGVGKGRTAAAIIRYGRLQGKAPIFVTQTVDLFSDIVRDLKGIKTEFTPFIMNSDEKIVDKEGTGEVLFRSMETEKKKKFIKRSPNLIEEGYDFMVSTYSQFNNTKYHDKIAFLYEQAKDNILILDESHNAGGEGTTSKVIGWAIQIAQGATYLSATFAKRPDNMPIYAIKTVISEANMTNEELVEAVKKGGVPLQEIISSQLVDAGQMIRRERSFEGAVVNYYTLGVSDEDSELIRKHKNACDKITEIMRDIITLQKKYIAEVVERLDEVASESGKEIKGRKGTSNAGVDNTPYFSRIFNVINQMLFSLKAQEVAQLAMKLAKEGKSVVIAFNSTMEAMLDSLDVPTGEVVENPDFAAVLQKGLESVFKITATSPEGAKSYTNIPVSELSNEGQSFYRYIRANIQKVATGISISPIDIIIDTLERAGLRVGEMTGRKRVMRFNKNGRGIIDKRRDKNKNELTRKFNAGELDVLLLNRSAATGISLHASKAFKNQKKRAMIIAQPQLDINAEVQMRGRVHRVGQVVAPEYWYVSSAIPAEMRLMMMLKKKLKSLDANTTSNQKQSAKKVLDSEDFLNKYGDEAVFQYLIENPELNMTLDDPLGINDSAEKASEGDAQKVTGRVAILSTKEQEKFYSDIIKAYNDYIELLKQSGDYDLELEIMPLEAETKEKRVVVVGNGGRSLFGSDSVLEKCEVNILKKPFKIKELQDKIEDALEGNTAQEMQNRLIETHKDFIEDRLEAIKDDVRKKIDSDMQKEIAKEQKRLGYILDESDEIMAALVDKYEKLYDDTVEEKQKKFGEEQKYLSDLFKLFRIGKAVNIPSDLEGTQGSVKVSMGIFLGFEIDYDTKNPFVRSKVKAKFAVNDGRKFLAIPLSQTKPLSAISSRSFMVTDADTDTYLKNWEKGQANKLRENRFIVTGNILQAFSGYKGKFADYTLKSGSNQKGIVMHEDWEDKAKDKNGNLIPQKVKVPIGKALPIIKGLPQGKSIVTADEIVGIQRTSRGYNIIVPQSKTKGGDYYMDSDILALTQGDFQKYANEMRAVLPEDNIDYFVGILQAKFSQSIEIDATQLDNIPETQVDRDVDDLIELPDSYKEEPPVIVPPKGNDDDDNEPLERFSKEALKFVPKNQIKTVNANLEAFQDVVKRINRIVAEMPKTYGQEKKKTNDKIIYLHYFYGNQDWYIIEKDSEKEQRQAFGYVNLGYEGEWGYIDIEELVNDRRIELEFYTEPTRFGILIGGEKEENTTPPPQTEGTHRDYLESEIEAFQIALELAENDEERSYLESEIEAFQIALELELEDLQ